MLSEPTPPVVATYLLVIARRQAMTVSMPARTLTLAVPVLVIMSLACLMLMSHAILCARVRVALLLMRMLRQFIHTMVKGVCSLDEWLPRCAQLSSLNRASGLSDLSRSRRATQRTGKVNQRHQWVRCRLAAALRALERHQIPNLYAWRNGSRFVSQHPRC